MFQPRVAVDRVRPKRKGVSLQKGSPGNVSPSANRLDLLCQRVGNPESVAPEPLHAGRIDTLEKKSNRECGDAPAGPDHEPRTGGPMLPNSQKRPEPKGNREFASRHPLHRGESALHRVERCGRHTVRKALSRFGINRLGNPKYPWKDKRHYRLRLPFAGGGPFCRIPGGRRFRPNAFLCPARERKKIPPGRKSSLFSESQFMEFEKAKVIRHFRKWLPKMTRILSNCFLFEDLGRCGKWDCRRSAGVRESGF